MPSPLKARASREVFVGPPPLFTEIETNSPQEFAKLVTAEIERWSHVVKASGAKAN